MLVKYLLVVASAFLGVLAQGSPRIETPPSLQQCRPAQLTITGGQGPYFVSALPAGQVSATPLKDFGQQSGSFTWNVDLAAGTSITLQVRDQTGQVGLSGIVTIQSTPDSSCVGKNSSVSPLPSSTGGASSPSATAPSPTGSTPSSGASGTSGASSPASGSSPAQTGGGSAASATTSPKPTSAALPLVPASVAGFIGALFAAVVA